MIWLGIGLLVFAAAAAYDWSNSHYIKANSEDRYIAILWSAVVSSFAVVGLLGMLEARWLAAPEIVGFATGTGIAIWQRRRRPS